MFLYFQVRLAWPLLRLQPFHFLLQLLDLLLALLKVQPVLPLSWLLQLLELQTVVLFFLSLHLLIQLLYLLLVFGFHKMNLSFHFIFTHLNQLHFLGFDFLELFQGILCSSFVLVCIGFQKSLFFFCVIQLLFQFTHFILQAFVVFWSNQVCILICDPAWVFFLVSISFCFCVFDCRQFLDFHDFNLEKPDLLILLQWKSFVLNQLIFQALSIHHRVELPVIHGFDSPSINDSTLLMRANSFASVSPLTHLTELNLLIREYRCWISSFQTLWFKLLDLFFLGSGLHLLQEYFFIFGFRICVFYLDWAVVALFVMWILPFGAAWFEVHWSMLFEILCLLALLLVASASRLWWWAVGALALTLGQAAIMLILILLDDIQIWKSVAHACVATSSKSNFFSFFTILAFIFIHIVILFMLFLVFKGISDSTSAELFFVSFIILFIEVISKSERIRLVQINLILSNIRINPSLQLVFTSFLFSWCSFKPGFFWQSLLNLLML